MSEVPVVEIAEAVEMARATLVESGGEAASTLFAPVVLAGAQCESEPQDVAAALGTDPKLTASFLDFATRFVDDFDLESIEDWLSGSLSDGNYHDLEGLVFERAFYVAGWDSSRFAMMTAGEGYWHGVELRGKVFWREGGGDAMDPDHYWFAYDAGDAAARKEAFLGLIGQLSGLAPGVTIGNEYEIDYAAEIRQITEEGDEYTENLADAIHRYVVIGDRVGYDASDYATRTGLSEADAATSLENLLIGVNPQTSAESDYLWDLYLELRL